MHVRATSKVLGKLDEVDSLLFVLFSYYISVKTINNQRLCITASRHAFMYFCTSITNTLIKMIL